MKSAASQKTRLKITVRGAVQGVGFRPFVHRLAAELLLFGWVNNSAQGVFIEVEGPRSALEQFLLRLEAERPPHCFIQSLESSWLDPVGYVGFEIRASEAGGDKTALVLPDIATCPDCLREIFDPTNRRFHYPFTNCTHCGPRFSIITALPYDRANTTMTGFTMCPACRAEYENPTNRRFHAQPNACHECGPQLEFWRGGVQQSAAEIVADTQWPRPAERSYGVLLAAAKAICTGKIVAVKGLGGFHLVVDARNEAAVRRLRERKHREEKPLALMFSSLEDVKAVCEVSALEQRLLRSPEAPIVLLRRLGRSGTSDSKSRIAESIAPGNPTLGAMLPYTPLHHLLLAELGFPVVATSGNLSDEPICTDEREAIERLQDIADVFLVHNRPIARHVDDSVVRVMLDRELVLRRARGYAPLPITVAQVSKTTVSPITKSAEHPPAPAGSEVRATTVLAVGAHLKNSVALAIGPQVFISQHIGDLETEQANAAFRRVIADLQGLYDSAPEIVATDLHPDYLSTKFVWERGCHQPQQFRHPEGVRETQTAFPHPVAAAEDSRAAQVVQVQHHIAHALSCMAENELEPPVLGVSWDGTGYGLDGTIWGGEFFLATEGAVERVAHFRPFRLPGGDAAVKEPRRSALGLLHALAPDSGNLLFHLRQKVAASFSVGELAVLESMLARNVNSPPCCSVGRLFDAVASLVGLRQRVRFEGQAAMELEFALEGVRTDEAYPLPSVECGVPPDPGDAQSEVRSSKSSIVLDWSPMVEAILADAEHGVPVGELSARFHNALAEAIVCVAQRVGQRRVVLTGGCFQNRYLTERAVTRLGAEGFQPYWHQRVPPNDGGIALGQVVAARKGYGAVVRSSA